MEFTAHVTAGALVAAALGTQVVGWRKRGAIMRWLVEPSGGSVWTAGGLDRPRKPPDVVLGDALLPVVIDPQGTHRRVEKLQFVGTERVIRHVSVDISLPGSCDRVPLGLIDKRESEYLQRPLRDFSARSGDGEALALLGHTDNAATAWAVLSLAVLRTLQAGGEVPPGPGGARTRVTTPEGSTANDVRDWKAVRRRWPSLEDILWRVVSEPSDMSEKICDLIFSDDPGVQSENALVVEAPTPDEEARALLRRLALTHFHLETLLKRLARCYLLVASLPDGRNSGRTVIKYQLADAIPWPLPLSRLAQNPSRRERDYIEAWRALPWHRRVRYRLQVFLAWLGWISDSVVPNPLTLLPARSVHVEVEVPEGLRITFAELTRRRFYRDSLAETVTDRELGSHPTLTHMFLNVVRVDDELSARLGVTPSASELSLGCAATVLLATYFWLARPTYGSSRPGEEALLLLIPAVVGGYLLLRQHSFVRRVSRGVRVMIALGAVLAISATALVVIATSAAPREEGVSLPDAPWLFDLAWSTASWIALVIAIVLVPAGLRAWPYTRQRSGKRRSDG